MNRVNALVAITVMAVMAGCAKKEAPQAQEGGDVTTAAQPNAKDRSKAAADMAAYLDPSPQCQQYRDELQAKGSTPGPIDELSEIFVRASKAGCGKKKQQ